MKMSFGKFSFVLAAMLVMGGQNLIAAPLSYTTVGATYQQNFDGLPTDATNASQNLGGLGPYDFSVVTGVTAGSLDGWYLARGAGNGVTEFKSQNGSLSGSAGRGVISFGTNGSAERALGTLPTSNTAGQFGLVVTNNTGITLTGFSISYVGEQWRSGDSGHVNSLLFAYGSGTDITGASLGGSTDLDLNTIVTPGPTAGTDNTIALDGNLVANSLARSGSISGLNWLPGDSLFVRWSGQDLPGSDNGLAVDNFSFTAVPEPSACLIAFCGLAGFIAYAIRKRATQSCVC